MKILVVSATEKEMNLFLQKNEFSKKTGSSYFAGNIGKLEISVFITGVGLPATIFQLTKELLAQKYDLVINCGIAGTFKESIPIGQVVYVESECFGDLGIDNRGEFLSLFDAGLCDKNVFPFYSGKLINKYNYAAFESLRDLPKVSAITVNKASGDESEIVKKWIKFQADVESMEGAGIFYTCMQLKVPFLELRSISNLVEARDSKKWNIPLALISLNNQLELFLQELEATL